MGNYIAEIYVVDVEGTCFTMHVIVKDAPSPTAALEYAISSRVVLNHNARWDDGAVYDDLLEYTYTGRASIITESEMAVLTKHIGQPLQHDAAFVEATGNYVEYKCK